MNTEHDENLPATPPDPLLDEEPSPHDTTPLQNDSSNPEHVDAIPQSQSNPDREKYEVSVRHYAQYHAPHDAYSPDVQKSIRYAARSPMGRFLADFFLILTRPGTFWQNQDKHPATLGQLFFPHLTLLIALRTLATTAGSLINSEAGAKQVLIQSLSQAFLIFVLLGLMSLIVMASSGLSGAKLSFDRATRFVGYSLTPMFFVGIIGIIPLPYISTICDLLAMPWAFVVMGTGILPFLKVETPHAPTLTALLCGLLLCLWGGLPILIPILLGILLP